MDKINRPPQLSGTAEDKIAQMWDYLVKMTDDLNGRLNGIGSNELTNDEREVMRPLMGDEMKSGRMITMKDMIIRTAEKHSREIREAKSNANAAMAVLKPFVDGIDCGAATNLNNLTEQGIYYFTAANAGTAVNAPQTTTAFNLIVLRRRLTDSVDTLMQYVLYGVKIWRRNNGASTESGWTVWSEIA